MKNGETFFIAKKTFNRERLFLLRAFSPSRGSLSPRNGGKEAAPHSMIKKEQQKREANTGEVKK
jgi:hypothetical protein